jgi:hypothetical protein
MNQPTVTIFWDTYEANPGYFARITTDFDCDTGYPAQDEEDLQLASTTYESAVEEVKQYLNDPTVDIEDGGTYPY